MEPLIGFEELYQDIFGLLRKIFSNSGCVSVAIRCDDSFLAFLVIRTFLQQFECRTWEKIYNSNDFLILGESETIKIDEVRSVFHFSTLNRSDLSHKYLFFQRLDEINIIVENSLLKLFEEPPADTFLIGTAVCWESLLPTLRSRMIKIDIPMRLHRLDFFQNLPREWQWIGKRNAGFAYAIREEAVEKLKKVLFFLREQTMETLFEDYLSICQEKIPKPYEAQKLNDKVLLEMLNLIFCEKIIVDLYGQNPLIELKRLLLSKACSGKRELTTKMWTVFFDNVGKTLKTLFFETVLHEVSMDWEDLCYPFLNKIWIESKKKCSWKNTIRWVEWTEKMLGKEWMVFHPDLSLYLLIEGLRKNLITS